MYERLEFGEFLLIAEGVLGEPAAHLHRAAELWRIELALAAPTMEIGGVRLYPEPVERAAICGARILRYRPFPRENKKIAYLCMRVVLERAGIPWPLSAQGDAELGAVLEALEAGRLSEAEFAAWMKGGDRE